MNKRLVRKKSLRRHYPYRFVGYNLSLKVRHPIFYIAKIRKLFSEAVKILLKISTFALFHHNIGNDSFAHFFVEQIYHVLAHHHHFVAHDG